MHRLAVALESELAAVRLFVAAFTPPIWRPDIIKYSAWLKAASDAKC